MPDEAEKKPSRAVDIPKNASETLRIQPTHYQGFNLVDIRVYVETFEGELRPTKKGITFKRSMLPHVVEALTKIGIEEGLIPSPDEGAPEEPTDGH